MLRANPKLLNHGYMFYRAITSDFIAYLTGNTTGAHYPAVSDGVVKSATIPLPSLTEQHRIVEILDQVNALRQCRAEADKKADRILPTLFYRMFGDPARNEKGWDVVPLADVIVDTRNGLYKQTELFGRGTPILKMFNIQRGEIDLTRVDRVEIPAHEEQAYRLLPGDILVNRVNTPELVGKCAVITEDIAGAVFESKNIRVRLNPKRGDPDFVAHYSNSPFGHTSLCRGVKHAIGMATINNADLREMQLPLPPLPRQHQWGKIVQKCRSNRAVRLNSRQRLDSLFSNLLHRAFTGDLTAKWREAHMKELLAEEEEQAKVLASQS